MRQQGRVYGMVALLMTLLCAVGVWAHQTNQLISQDFIDGSVAKASVRYSGNNTAGNKHFSILNYDADYLGFWTINATPMIFFTNSVERLRIYSTGDAIFHGGGEAGGVLANGNQDRIYGLQRHSTSNTAGNDLTLGGGGATSGATDKDGGAVVIAPGQSTGTGRSVVYLDGYNTATSTGTTDNSQIHRNVWNGYKTLANNTTTDLVSMTLANGTATSAILHYGVEVVDGTDVQVESGMVVCIITNDSGAVANNACTKSGNVQAVTSGTLTVTFTITAAYPALVQVNSNSSLTPTSTKFNYEFKNLGNQQVAVQ